MRFCQGDTVEFETNLPGHEGETVQGTVTWAPDLLPGNLDILTPLGRHEVHALDLRLVRPRGAGPTAITHETAYGRTVPLSFTILCF